MGGGNLQITYATSGLDGQPSFTYQDSVQSRSFHGSDQISTAETMIGMLLSVTLNLTPDSGTTIFSLLVPDVALDSAGHLDISTFGVTTVRRSSFIGPPLGQDDLYTTSELKGLARIVKF